MDFASLMSAQISKNAKPATKSAVEPQGYKRQAEVEAAREAAYRAEQAARENERLAKAELKRRADEEEIVRREEKAEKRRRLNEENKKRREEEEEQAERERRRRIGLPEVPVTAAIEDGKQSGTPEIDVLEDIEEEKLSEMLRNFGEPRFLFGEGHDERLRRYHKLKEARQKALVHANKRKDQPIPTLLEPLPREELEVTECIPPASDQKDRLLLVRRVATWLNMVLYEWNLALARRDANVKESTEGKKAMHSHLQAKEHLKPLFEKLEKLPTDPTTFPDDLLKPTVQIVARAQRRQYVRANDAYLQLSIGKAAWPIGVTMVGIHERSSRERIGESELHKAHILSDEETRKILQSIKRCLTFAQTKWPPEDAGQLMG